MKKLVYKIAIMAVAALTFASCQKEINTENVAQDGIDVTITAGNPITKTVLGEDGTTPYWKDGDALSVTNGTTSNVKFEENNIAEGETSAIATFSGKVSAAGDYYAVYPHTGATATTSSGGYGPRVSVPSDQHPTATSFDGDADIMVSKLFTVTGTTTTTVNNLQFARCGAILKVVLAGKTSVQQSQLANQHPVSISLTAENDLVGNVVFDYENATASIYSTPSKTVSATYTNSTNYLIDGVNAAYLVVVPTTLTGSIDIAAITEDYEISRTLTLPTSGIELEAGKIYTFNVSLGANSIVEATPAQALPWSDDFSWHTSTSETNYVSTIATTSNGEWSAGTYVYGATEAGAIRIGTSSSPGSITSKLINLSGAFKVTVRAKAYNINDKAKITVTIGDVTKTAADNLDSSYVDYEFDFAAGDGTSKSPIIIETTQKRAVITSVSVNTYVPKAATPTFSPAAGAVEENTVVTISSTTEGADIYYTTDGTTPTTESTKGNSVTIDAAKTIKAIAIAEGYLNSNVATAEYTISGTPEALPYSNSLISGHNGFTINNVSLGSLSSIWSDTTYGVQANAYQTTSNVESYLESPYIDLTGVSNAKLAFSHGINYFANVATAKTQATLQVRVKNGTWANVEIPTYPASLGNSFADAEVSLLSYVGNVIQFRFKYLATSTNPGRWQIKNLSVTEVIPVTLSSITVSGQTTSFTQGGTFSFGGTVTAIYSDSSTAEVTSSASFSGYDMSTTGSQTVTVSYTEGGITRTTTYGINVSAPGSKKTYTLSLTGDNFEGNYNSGNPKNYTFTAVASDSSTMDVEIVSTNVMKNAGIQFKASGGNFYNTTDLGSIISITQTVATGKSDINVKYINTSSNPTSDAGSGGFFKVGKSTSGAAVLSQLVIVFEK